MRWSAFCALFPVVTQGATLALALAFSSACPVPARAASFDQDPPSELADVLVRKAKRAEKSGDIAVAYVYYSQASALQPRNRSYRNRAAALKIRGAAQIKSASAPPSASAISDALAPATDAEIHHAALAPELMF